FAPTSLLESFRGGLKYGTGESAVVLTIDAALQTYVEDVLDHTLEQYFTARGGAIVMDPRTGRILAMAGRPTFDPNDYQNVSSEKAYINPNTKNQYEMGSVVKPLTFLAAFNAGAVRPTDTYFDSGYRKIDGYTVNNHDKKGRGTIPLQEILNQSLNTGVIHLMEKMGMSTFSAFFTSLKLGEKTGIEVQETPGNIKNLSSKYEIDHATASFGQGIGVTPIGLIRALSTVANSGVEPMPYLVEEVRHADGTVTKHADNSGERVASEVAAAQISKMLVTVVDDALLQGKGKITGYSVGAKTGTAQLPNPNGAGYIDAYLHSFFGYAPATNPKFIVLLYMERPVGAAFSSISLTPPFKDIMTYALQYYQIPPDRQTQ
ncbi:MAG: penicillin-binding protein 2, partial [Patescibacteria group bacterium]